MNSLHLRRQDRILAETEARELVPGRPKSFYPRLDQVTVYALDVERITGKHCPLPPMSEQWPALDRTNTPDAKPPT